ncbi:MAG: 4-alpha-glucanotransferase [Aerococcus sp.]|nr:4-alpha-glucanotransferase [Aerococcus sp.]
MERSSGVLMHITSLPGPYGIGTLGAAAYRFVDFLVETKQTYWQVLPLTTTSYGDSPYQSFSAYAGNTNLIDFDRLIAKDLLAPNDLTAISFGSDVRHVDFGRLFVARRYILEQAVARFEAQGGISDESFKRFYHTQKEWLIPFCRYMTVKEHFDQKPWYEWPDDYRIYDATHVDALCEQNQNTYHYHLVTQFFFNQQWQALKGYANAHQIKIIGDIPIYVARDSVEMWMFPELFKVNASGDPRTVAGTPPDNFSATGQYWGNPIYDWQTMADDHYQWWAERIRYNLSLYDVLRIDHFKGFESYWEIPFGAPDASYGHWEKGPGKALFQAIFDQLGPTEIIAEDLGFMNDQVVALREFTGFPGMKVELFGFDSDGDSTDLPHHYPANSVAYVGTHDNETARGWYEALELTKQERMAHYLCISADEPPAWALNRGIAASHSNLAIYTMQNLLNLGTASRMNTPGTIGGNWQWRMVEEDYTDTLTQHLKDITTTYCRENPALRE